MKEDKFKITFLGLSITSSWGNGHATTFRSLIKGLHQEGHDIHFLERDVPWYANHRDFSEFPYCKIHLYEDLEKLKENHLQLVESSDVVIVGSYVPDGVAVGQWVQQSAAGIKAFYDIDTPVTLEKLYNEDYEYLHPDLIPGYDIYLSFTGGKTLDRLQNNYGSPRAEALYCSVDTDLYYPEEQPPIWDLGYLGTYSPDRQPTLDKLLISAALKLPNQRFIIAGPQYPKDIQWPVNVERSEHLPPEKHKRFYNQQRFTLNVTREAMIEAGYAPSVRLFEAAACATPIISDYWEGLDSIFEFNKEILIARSSEEAVSFLLEIDEQQRHTIGRQAREKILQSHSYRQRARQLLDFIHDLMNVSA
ncbi:MAG: glycosyltransferase [Cyclobacteriaceae bacterium]